MQGADLQVPVICSFTLHHQYIAAWMHAPPDRAAFYYHYYYYYLYAQQFIY